MKAAKTDRAERGIESIES